MKNLRLGKAVACPGSKDGAEPYVSSIRVTALFGGLLGNGDWVGYYPLPSTPKDLDIHNTGKKKTL